MGCAFSQESEDSRYRRKQARLQKNHVPSVTTAAPSKSQHGRSMHSQQQQQQAPQANSNVYSPVIKTATVNSRGSRTSAAPIKSPAITAATPGATSAASPASASSAQKQPEPEDIHFRRQHFDRNSVLRHSKKRSRKASSPYASAATAAAAANKTSQNNEVKPEDSKVKDANVSAHNQSAAKENSSAVANTPTSAVPPKRNATTIAISTDGSSRVLTNGDTSSEAIDVDGEPDVSWRSRSPAKQQQQQQRRSIGETNPVRTPNNTSAVTPTSSTRPSAVTPTSSRAARSDIAVTSRQAPRLRSRSRHEQEDLALTAAASVTSPEEKSDECGRLI